MEGRSAMSQAEATVWKQDAVASKILASPLQVRQILTQCSHSGNRISPNAVLITETSHVGSGGGGSSLFSRSNTSDGAPMRGMSFFWMFFGILSVRVYERGWMADADWIGLVKFIADLRNARARELEEKRINKELANIR